MPAGVKESNPVPQPIFTPATKAESGHDINISEAEAATIIGKDLTDRLKHLTLEIFRRGCAHAESKGIIIADTKFEFGLVGAGIPATDVVLIDEVLTPDSSRFWPKDQYKPGGAVPSFDKQYVRDYLEEIHWNKQPPVPSLPDTVVERTREIRRKRSGACPAASSRERTTRPRLVADMLDKGVTTRTPGARFEEAVHRARSSGQRESLRRRQPARSPSEHGRPENGRIPHQANGLRIRQG